jgi:hypothetical protein
VLFFYLHIFFHLKTNNDLEIYDIPQPSKEQFEEICDLRQPVLFYYDKSKKIEDFCNKQTIEENYGAFDVKIRTIKKPFSNTNTNENNENNENNESTNNTDETIYSLIPFKDTKSLMETNNNNNNNNNEFYLFEKNTDFLEETELIKQYKYNDEFLRPSMVSSCEYDFMFGSPNTQTPFRYELNYRNFYLVTEGEIKVKLAPPRSTKYLHLEKDYVNMEFRTPVNPWDIQDKYKNDFSKIRCLDTTVKKGQLLYIPAYWWYSIDLGENASICSFKYRTYMNTLAIADKLFLRFLQLQNVKRNII